MKIGDKVYSVNMGKIELYEIIGFSGYATLLKNKEGKEVINLSSCKGLFYRFGYYKNGVDFILAKKWHYPFVLLTEWVRLKLPTRIALKLKLE